MPNSRQGSQNLNSGDEIQVGRFQTLALIGVSAPWVVAVGGGALLGTVGRHWPESTVFIVGCAFVAVLCFVGVPVTIFSWAYLNRKDRV